MTLTGELSTKKPAPTRRGRDAVWPKRSHQGHDHADDENGEYTIGLRPGRNTVYTVQAGSTKSEPVSVKVRPRVRLGRVAAHRYSLRVFAAQRFAGRVATLQRYAVSRGSWVFVKRVRLHSNSTNILPTVVSSVAFRSVVPPRARLRALLPQSQLGGCYLTGTSNTIRA